MSILQIVSLKRAAIQSKIDAIAARETALTHQIIALRNQSDGLGLGEAGAGFQLAAMASQTARQRIHQLELQTADLAQVRTHLARQSWLWILQTGKFLKMRIKPRG